MITHPCPSFYGELEAVIRSWESNFIPYKILDIVMYPCPNLCQSIWVKLSSWCWLFELWPQDDGVRYGTLLLTHQNSFPMHLSLKCQYYKVGIMMTKTHELSDFSSDVSGWLGDVDGGNIRSKFDMSYWQICYVDMENRYWATIH